MSAITVVLLSITDVFAVLINAAVIYTFAKIKSQLTFKDILMVGMAVSDILQCLLGYPLEIYSSQHGQWKFNVTSCKASGFFITFLGLVSINYLAVVAFDLYISICKPYFSTVYHGSQKFVVASNVFPWLFSFFWAVVPFLGWSSYALEDDNLRCSINWNGKSASDKSYVAALYVFCYILPVGMMLFAFSAVKRELRQMQKRAVEMAGMQMEAMMETVQAEKRHTKLAIVMSTAFVVSWTPYTVISFWSSYFKHVATVPKYLGTISAVFAKLSTLCNPIIYSFLHAKFRRNLDLPFIGKVFKQNTVNPGWESSVRPTSSTGNKTLVD
ncbi:pinopsin-like isoform X2 [Rhopilema esculentum]|uniref:pinopsin-like isoform X2 n=1 Tax=Rhopilema esculentum TaxID=499914 RepID=UPI0031D53107